MRLRADVVEEVRDQAEPDLGTLQRQIMSLRLYVINTYLEVKDRLFSLSRTREPVWRTGLLTLSCFQCYSQITKVSSGISTWPCGHRKQKKQGKENGTTKIQRKESFAKLDLQIFQIKPLFHLWIGFISPASTWMWKGRKPAPRQAKITLCISTTQ